MYNKKMNDPSVKGTRGYGQVMARAKIRKGFEKEPKLDGRPVDMNCYI